MEVVLAPEVFDRLQQAMASDPGGLAELYREYLSDARRTLRELQSAFDVKDEQRLRALAHSLKGSSQILGAPVVAQRSAELESAAIARDLNNAQSLIAQTAAALDAAQRELENRLGTAVNPDARPGT